MHSPRLLAVALALTITSAGCDSAGPPPTGPDVELRKDQAKTGKPLPFLAHYEARLVGIEPASDCTAGPGRFLVEGEGRGTHLGHFTIDLSFCGGGSALSGGRGTFVAASGDLLFITFTGDSDEAFPILHFTSHATFVGGTGRFEGATGTVEVPGTFDIITGLGSADWIGSIAFAKPRKH